jgi:Flp pilus assembly protein TadD
LARRPLAGQLLPSAPTKHIALAGIALAAAAFAVYAHTFSAPFVFDDIPSILDNASIRQLWPLWTPLSPPSELLGLPVGGRPLVNVSLALNYALGGTTPAGYRAVNLLIHALAGLALFGVVRRTLRLSDSGSPSQARDSTRRPGSEATHLSRAATPLAFAVALLWTVHPLQTESVTYVCQRAESLMALCYLMTLYAFIRSTESSRPLRWWLVSAFACLLGMATKEVMVSAPLIVLLYDRTFVSGSFAAAWRARSRFHLTLAATWGVLAALVLGNLHRGGTAGFEAGITPWTYALTQVYAIAHYLRLAFWPHPLVFDYGTETVTGAGALALPALVLAVLLALTVHALVRRPALGFVGAAFFALLAPTSSFVPVATQTIAEHRMYLPLAGVLVLAILALHRLAARRAVLIAGLAALGLGAITVARNADYHSAASLWSDTVAKRPTNSRAQSNLGILLFQSGQTAEAIARFEAALHLRPAFPEARANLGNVYLQLNRPADALPLFVEALRLKPDFPEARSNLGLALKQLGRTDEAAAAFRETIRRQPAYAEAHHNLAIALLEANQLPAALEEFSATLRLKPDFADAHSNYGVALMRAGRFDEAIIQYESALLLNPRSTAARENLAALQAHLRETRPGK